MSSYARDYVDSVAVTDIPLPWKHPFGTVVGYEYPADRPRVVDLVLSDGLRTAETRTAVYRQRKDDTWDIARFVSRKDAK